MLWPRPRRSSTIPSRIHRTLHAPTLRHAANRKKVADHENSQDAARASIATCQHAGPNKRLLIAAILQKTLQAMASRHARTPRRLLIAVRILRTLHVPPSRHAADNERVDELDQNSQASPQAGPNGRIVDCGHNSEDAPRRPINTPQKTAMGQRHDTPGLLLQLTRGQNAQDAPGASPMSERRGKSRQPDPVQ